jgi:hypothetical protein
LKKLFCRVHAQFPSRGNDWFPQDLEAADFS